MSDDKTPAADDAAPSLEESAELIARQRRRAAAHLEPDPLLLYLPWGLAWLVGFGAFAAHFGVGDQEPASWMPLGLAGAILGAGLGAAILATGLVGYRSSRHISGPSGRRGAVYGLSWVVGFGVVMSIAGQIAPLLPEPETAMLFAGLSMAITAILYIAGHAIWDDRSMLVLGLVIGAATLVASLLGADWFFVVAAIVGGGGFIVAAVTLRPAWKRARR